MSDHHLVPEGSAWLDGRDLGHRQVQIGSFIGNVWLDQDRTVGIERRPRARLDPHGGAHIGVIARFHLGIPEEECLPVGIGRIDLHAPGSARRLGHELAQVLRNGPVI